MLVIWDGLLLQKDNCTFFIIGQFVRYLSIDNQRNDERTGRHFCRSRKFPYRDFKNYSQITCFKSPKLQKLAFYMKSSNRGSMSCRKIHSQLGFACSWESVKDRHIGNGRSITSSMWFNTSSFKPVIYKRMQKTIYHIVNWIWFTLSVILSFISRKKDNKRPQENRDNKNLLRCSWTGFENILYTF